MPNVTLEQLDLIKSLQMMDAEKVQSDLRLASEHGYGRKFSDSEMTKADEQGLIFKQVGPEPVRSPEEIIAEEQELEKVAEEGDGRGRGAMPRKEYFLKAGQDRVIKDKVYEADIFGKAMDLNNGQQFIDIVKPELKGLHDIDNKLIEIKTRYEEAKADLGKKEGIASIMGLLGHLVVGSYGIKKGIDTSGTKFNMVNWDNKYKELLQQYDIDRQYLGDQRGSIKEFLAQKKGAINEAQQVARRKEQDIEQIYGAKYSDAMNAWQQAEQDRAREDKDQYNSAAAAAMTQIVQYKGHANQMVAQSRAALSQAREIEQELNSIASGIVSNTPSKKLTAILSPERKAQLTLAPDARVSKADVEKLKPLLYAEIKERTQDAEDKQKKAQGIMMQAKVMEVMVRNRITSGDPVADLAEFEQKFNNYKDTYKGQEDKRLSRPMFLRKWMEDRQAKAKKGQL